MRPESKHCAAKLMNTDAICLQKIRPSFANFQETQHVAGLCKSRCNFVCCTNTFQTWDVFVSTISAFRVPAKNIQLLKTATERDTDCRAGDSLVSRHTINTKSYRILMRTSYQSKSVNKAESFQAYSYNCILTGGTSPIYDNKILYDSVGDVS
jgi:hypothetical protein